MVRRRLTAEERRRIVPALVEAGVASREVCEAAAESCRFVQRLPSLLEVRGVKSAVAYAALRSRACGVTLGDDVYIRSEFFGADLELPLRLVAHEVAHVAQFRRDGTAAFLTRYVLDYTMGLARGMGDRRAYRAISYEREARRVAELAVPVRN